MINYDYGHINIRILSQKEKNVDKSVTDYIKKSCICLTEVLHLHRKLNELFSPPIKDINSAHEGRR